MSARRASSGQVRQRRVGAHPAGVRARVAVEQALVVARQRQGDGVARRRRSRSTLASRPIEPLLDDERPRRRSPRAIAAIGLVDVVADGHALAGGEAVGLDHDAAARRGQLRDEGDRRGPASAERPAAGHRHAGGRRDLVAERLARLDPGGRRATGRRPRIPASRERVGDAGRERRLGPDDDELRGHRPGRARRRDAPSSGSTSGRQRTRGSRAIAGTARARRRPR